MSDENNLVSLNQIYKDIPIIQQLISALFAALSCGDPKLAVPTMAFYGISVLVDKLKIRRTKIFFDELAKGRISLTPELIEKNEFLHCFFSTYSAAIGTYRKEKIEFFARLLINGINEELISELAIDEYEKNLKILTELSYEEIVILNEVDELLDKHKPFDPYIKESEKEEKIQAYYKDLKLFGERIGKDISYIRFIIGTTERLGCFIKFYEFRFGDTHYEGRGVVTGFFKNLKKMIMEVPIERQGD